MDNQLKKVLGLLYTNALGKIYSLKNNSHLKLITDVEKFLDSIKKDIRDLKQSNVINKTVISYETTINVKIREATEFIRNQILPEIEKIKVQMDDKINLLVEEVVSLKEQANKQKDELTKKRKELENSLVICRMLGGVNFTMQIASCLIGPGAVAISLTFSLIQTSKHFVFNSDDGRFVTSSLPPGLKTYMEDLKKILINNEDLNSQSPSNFNANFSTTANQASSNIGKTIQIDKFGIDILNAFKNDEKKMTAIEDAIRQAHQNIIKLEKFECKIYSNMVPVIKSMENSLSDVATQLNAKSHVFLDVTKWKVKSALIDMKLQLKQFTKGFKIEEDLVRCIEKLEEAMTGLIDIYDRIQNYQEQKQLSDYISNTVSADFIDLHIEDQELNRAVRDLENAIRSNLVLDKYKMAANALKQHVFPLAHFYMNDLTLPAALERENNFENLVEKSTQQLEKIILKITECNSSINQHDRFIMNGWFNNICDSSRPFYVWKNSMHKEAISKLLSGKKVVLKAEVTKSDYDAIKFSEIGLSFSSDNKSLSLALHNKLKNFNVKAIHLGNSYYRFKNDIYVFTCQSQDIEFSYEKNENGNPVRTNNVYDKIKSGNIMLSPYAMWEFQLTNSANEAMFSALDEFKELVDLELVGFGSYIKKEAYFDNNDFDKYYKNALDPTYMIIGSNSQA